MKAIISKAARRKWAWVLALVMIVSIVIPTSLLTAKADVGTVKFIDGAAGWLESAYAQWAIDNQAEGYTAYIKKASQSDSAYARIDNELIRKYKNYYIPQIAERRFSVVKEFTEQYQVVCALKDSRTVVMKEGHHPFLNLAGNSAMAKAGSGDVLAGMISGLAAQKTDIFDAVSAGVYFHACGGDEARKKKGSYSVLARDLIDGIGQCLKNAEERL